MTGETNPRTTMPPRLVVFVLWGALLAAGFVGLQRHQMTPGPRAEAPQSWPRGSGLSQGSESYNLVVALHPRCPCSRSSVSELARLLAAAPTPVCTHVLFWAPAEPAPEWNQTGVTALAERLPGAAVVLDVGGMESALFGAATSGQVLLYAPGGQLLYSGGVTGARGHEGGNPGADALAARLRGEDSRLVEMPVFGCPLFEHAGAPGRAQP